MLQVKSRDCTLSDLSITATSEVCSSHCMYIADDRKLKKPKMQNDS
jgi:hypothetical protein